MKKSILCLLIAIVSIFTLSQGAFSAGEDVKVYLDGTELTFDTPPQIVDGRTMVPMRVIFEAIGAQINWDENSKSVTAITDTNIIALIVGNKTAYVNGNENILDAAPFISNSRTYVPLRFIGESTGATVEWDGDARTVIITSALE